MLTDASSCFQMLAKMFKTFRQDRPCTGVTRRAFLLLAFYGFAVPSSIIVSHALHLRFTLCPIQQLQDHGHIFYNNDLLMVALSICVHKFVCFADRE